MSSRSATGFNSISFWSTGFVALARHRLVADDLEAGTLIRPFGSHAVTLASAYRIVTPDGADTREAVKIAIAWLRREAERQRGADGFSRAAK